MAQIGAAVKKWIGSAVSPGGDPSEVLRALRLTAQYADRPSR